jgi:hypothetical protein
VEENLNVYIDGTDLIIAYIDQGTSIPENEIYVYVESASELIAGADGNNNLVAPIDTDAEIIVTGGGVPNGGTTGQVLTKQSNTDQDTYWTTAGVGTVTSVGLSMPTEFTVASSPVTGAGTIGVTKTSQAQNLTFSSPDGSAGVPTFRALVANDIPSLPANKIPLANTTTDGYLSQTDWNTFNGKYNLPALTAGSVLFSDGTTISQDNPNFTWNDVLNYLYVNNKIQIGSVDAFSRSQIWNAMTNASLRLGALAQDGDFGDVNSEGIVAYGPNSQGTAINSTTGNFGYARIKADRIGLLTSILNVQNYYFRADPTEMYLRNDAGTKTFTVTRSTGNIKTAMGLGRVKSDASGNLSSVVDTATIGITIDGGGNTPTTGTKAFLKVPYACTITGWTIVSDIVGSAVIDIWKDIEANFPPTIADTITAAAKPTLSSQQLVTGSPTGWTVAVAAGDILLFNLDSVSTLNRVQLFLQVNKTP